LKLNVRSALEILLQQNTVDQDERLKRNTTQFFLPIIRKCLNVQVQDRFDTTKHLLSRFNIYFNRPTFAELLEELGGKPYVSPIQYSLQLTLFNGITPVLDHNLDLSDFKNLDC
jgi:hypothetical protein